MIVNERLVTYLDSLTWQIPEPMQELEQWALQKEVPIIRRSMQSLLLFMLRLRQPKHVLEIGTAVGFSALLMRSELLPDATLDTIEKFRREFVMLKKILPNTHRETRSDC